MAYVDRLFYALQTPLERYLKGGAAHELVHVFTAALAVGRQEVVVHEQLHAVMVRGTERQGSSGAETDAAAGRNGLVGQLQTRVMHQARQELAADEPTAGKRIGEVTSAEQRQGIEGVVLGQASVDNDGGGGHREASAYPDVRVEEPCPFQTCRTAGGGAELMLLVDVVTAQRDVQTHVQAEERRSVRAVDESSSGSALMPLPRKMRSAR